ncbi:hypothetical protein ACFC0D_26720 [Streptomyces sp. NPDC056222]
MLQGITRREERGRGDGFERQSAISRHWPLGTLIRAIESPDPPDWMPNR